MPKSHRNTGTISAEELQISKYMTAITGETLRDKIMKEKTLEMKKIIDLIKQKTYEKNNEKNTIPEALISAKENTYKKKSRYKEWKDSEQERKTKTWVTDRADFVVLQTGHHYTNVPQHTRTAKSAERKDTTRKHADRNSTTTEQRKG